MTAQTDGAEQQEEPPPVGLRRGAHGRLLRAWRIRREMASAGNVDREA